MNEDLAIQEIEKQLTTLFDSAPHSALKQFLNECVKEKGERQHFLSALLYGFWFQDFFTFGFNNTLPNSMHYFLFLILAETTSNKTLQKVLNSLSLSDLIALICYAHLNYREGSYQILHTLETTQKNPEILTLLQGLSRKYLNVYILADSLRESTRRPLASIQILKKTAKHEVKALYKSFYVLIDAIIESPLRLQKHWKKMGSEEEAKAKSLQLKNLFAFSLNKRPTLEQFDAFFQLYGLQGHYPILKVFGKDNSLLKRIQKMEALFKNGKQLLDVSIRDLEEMYAYVFKISYHLYSFHSNTSRYVEGAQLMTYGIPTKDKELAQLPCLSSVVKGYATLDRHLQSKGIHLPTLPIFVFDQSKEALFAKNRTFIKKLQKSFKGDIVHLSQKEILLLARKLKIDKLIQTAGHSFGYGGARNCVFLLTPLLRAAYDQGKKSLAEVLKMTHTSLRALLEESVLAPQERSIVMGDDDLEVPEANLFSQLLYAQAHRNAYFSHRAYVCGRRTTFVNPLLDLKSFLDSPTSLFAFTRWQKEASFLGIFGLLSKPKFCLNLPFGFEEEQLAILIDIFDPFTQPVTHLAGTRYPTGPIPSDMFSGLAETLKSIVINVFQVGMVQSLIDPLNHKMRCALPWNADPDGKGMRFKSLGEAFAFAALSTTQSEMQRRFWENVKNLLSTDQKQSFLLGRDLESLIGQDPNALIIKYCQKKKPTASLRAIAQVYKTFQKDALLFLDYLKAVQIAPTKIDKIKKEFETTRQIQLHEWPFTYSLHLLLHAVGMGEFNILSRSLKAKIFSS